MGDLFGTVAAAVGVFAGTNIDDLLVLTVLFLAARTTGRPSRRQIWLGQYAGMAALTAVSALAALGLAVVPDRWVGLAGLVPLGLGVWGLVRTLRDGDGDPPVVATSAAAIAGVTIANGADNIAVYTPLLRTIGAADSLVTILVFAVAVAAWCLAATWLGSHRRVTAVVERFGHWLVPGVFVLLGVLIMVQSGVLAEITG